MGTRDSLGIKRPGLESDHALPSSAEVKYAWSYTPLLHISWRGVQNSTAWYLVKHMGNGSGAHPAYLMGARGSFTGVKRPKREADHSPPSSAEVKECVDLYFHSPNTPSWRGAQFKKKSTGATLHYVYHRMFNSLQIMYRDRPCREASV
jgi:hypothetical protein